MIRFAKITAINEKFIWLEVEKNNACVDCKHQCGKNQLDLFGLNKKTIKVNRNPHSSQTSSNIVDQNYFFKQKHQLGQIVGMKIDPNYLLYASMKLYLNPLLIVLFFMSLGFLSFKYSFMSADLVVIIGFLIGLSIIVSQTKNILVLPKVPFF
ncbi:MAG: SoxR reducing system RseC family protein [Proteobacteria bacterium]|nr:SoxR reducing system RseC family protein [Pseudomonadota bacterium]